MINPFLDFRLQPHSRREIPLERIVRAKQEVMDRIVAGYLRVIEEEVKDLVWLVEHSRLLKVYKAALESIQGLRYVQDDIEEFCTELDNSEKIPFMILGPAGIYISALINRAQEKCIVLRLRDYKRIFHFLGYRLPEGRALILHGHAGDFTGAGLAGGRLVVEGSTGDWCGAGMINGEILVNGRAGEKTGEWMRGGDIHVNGRIRGIGETFYGGRIYKRGKLIVPSESVEDT
jgi:hypothetical protein